MDLATILGKHNQNWQVLVFLTLLCIVLGFVAKLCRESRCFGVKFYVANHAVLVPHFDAQKGVRATKQLFCRSAAKSHLERLVESACVHSWTPPEAPCVDSTSASSAS